MKVLIADDHALLRTGLAHSLGELAPGTTAYEAADATQVLETLGTHSDLDLILLDLFMPGANGFELLSQVCGSATAAPVVVLSASEDAGHMRKALDCGAAGFIPKSAPREVMLSALRLVLAGGVYLPPELMRAPPPSPAQEASPDDPGVLTERQREVLQRLTQGSSNKQIARDLGLSENTVKVHVAAILRALGASNRTEAALQARELGINP
jgi:DNA-binding NarL/FixJ family response regulator